MLKSLIINILVFFVYQVYSAQEVNYRNFHTNTGSKAKGIALILGNDDYINTGKLSSAVKDARLITKILKQENFDIEIGYNLNKISLLNAINDFSIKLPKYKKAIIYYAGHGVQIDNENYLLPIDAKGSNNLMLKNTSVSISDLFNEINEPEVPKVIFLDACRENPFIGNITSSTMTVKGSGLAKVKSKLNSMVVFSTSPNTIVPDSNPFSEILSEEIALGGCINDILIRTTARVEQLDKNQHIWTGNQNLKSNICFGKELLMDSDGDGLIDTIDKCPNQKGPINNDGCPIKNKPIKNIYKRFSGIDDTGEENIGIKNQFGETVVKPNSKYAVIDKMNEYGLARFITYDGKMGYINHQGQEIIGDENYRVSRPYKNRGFIKKKNDSRWIMIDKQGKQVKINNTYNEYSVLPCANEQLSLVEISLNEKWGLANLDGKIIVPADFDYISSGHNQILYGKRNGTIVYFNPSGKYLFTQEYDYCGDFEGDFATVSNKGGLQGFINKKGNTLYTTANTLLNYDGYIIERHNKKKKTTNPISDKIVSHPKIESELKNYFNETIQSIYAHQNFNNYSIENVTDNIFLISASQKKWKKSFLNDEFIWIRYKSSYFFLEYENNSFSIKNYFDSESNFDHYFNFYLTSKTDTSELKSKCLIHYELLNSYNKKGELKQIYNTKLTVSNKNEDKSCNDSHSGGFISGVIWSSGFVFYFDNLDRIWIFDDDLKALKIFKPTKIFKDNILSF